MSEFPAANFTHVTREAAVAQESCYSLASNAQGSATRRAVLHNAKLREDNVTIPIPYIESVQFDSRGVDPLYLTVRNADEGVHFLDVSDRNRIAISDTSGNSMLIDGSGVYLSSRECVYSVSVLVADMLRQLRDLAGVRCAAAERWKRREDMDFTQVLNMHDQCGQPVDRSIREYPRLLVGNSACTDTDVDLSGRWEFDCTFPGSASASMACQRAVKNDVVDFLVTDPFEGSCPDIATVITTLSDTARDFLSTESFAAALQSQHLNDTQAQGATAASEAFGRLWHVFQEMLSKHAPSSPSTSSPEDTSPLERYMHAYNTHRDFASDICEDLHASEVPFNLSLTAGATHIDALTTLNWAPQNPRPYNVTVQDPSAVACCPNGSMAQREGDTCAYPPEASVPGTGCVCGTTASGMAVAFEYVECGNYVGVCESDEDCEGSGHEGFVCLTGSCCEGGVCVDPYACSQGGMELVRSGVVDV